MLAPGDDFADALNNLQTFEYRIYGDPYCNFWVIVDYEDYLWAIQWCWNLNKKHPKVKGKKQYLRRSRSWGGRYSPPLYLHIEIMKRKGEPQPFAHSLVDHIDGNERDCRRSNLRWATHKMNRANSRGRNAIRHRQSARHV